MKPQMTTLGLLVIMLTACSAGHGLFSGSGRVPGDHGRLLPKLSCWIDANTKGDSSDVISLAVPAGEHVNCRSAARGLQASLRSGVMNTGYTASVTSPVPVSQLPSQLCRGTLYVPLAVPATAFSYSSGILPDSLNQAVMSALGCNT